MPYRILKGLVYTLGLVTLVTLVVAEAIEYNGGAPFGSRAGALAWWVSVWPLIACGVFTMLQGMPGGRKIVPAPWSRAGDVWPLILVLLMATPSAEAGRLVRPGSAVGSSDFVLITLVTVLLCVIGRVIQLNMGARLGVTLEDGTVPTA